MKKFLHSVLFCLLVVFAFTGCNSSVDSEKITPPDAQDPNSQDEGHYTVTLNDNGRLTEITACLGEELPSLTSIPSDDYPQKFGGYYTERYARGTQYIDQEGKACRVWDIASDTTLYAAWGVEITYNDPEEVENPNLKIYTGKDDIILQDLESNSDRKFIGWFENDGKKVDVIPKGDTGDGPYLTARWEYKINYENTNDVENPNPEYYPDRDDIILLSLKSTYDRVFLGWYDAPLDGNKIEKTSSKLRQAITLYARWGNSGVYTADELITALKNGTVKDAAIVSGAITNAQLSEISKQMKNKETYLGLYLKNTNGITSLSRSFLGNEYLTQLEIPNGVTNISNEEFAGCRSLLCVNIPSSVTSIGEKAFRNCEKLESIDIPSGITCIEYFTFGECINLTNVVIPTSVTSINGYAFYKCYNLKNISIPSSVESIGEGAFEYCKRLESINIPSGITTIEICTFAECTKLANVTIPYGVTKIDGGAFGNCYSLRNIEIPSSVKSLSGFSGCYKLESIEIPSGVTFIGSSAFAHCSRLKNIVIPSGVTSIGNSTFNNCNGLKSIVIPSGVTSIGEQAFYYCTGLESVVIPANVTRIGDRAFYLCSADLNFEHKTWKVDEYLLMNGECDIIEFTDNAKENNASLQTTYRACIEIKYVKSTLTKVEN